MLSCPLRTGKEYPEWLQLFSSVVVYVGNGCLHGNALLRELVTKAVQSVYIFYRIWLRVGVYI